MMKKFEEPTINLVRAMAASTKSYKEKITDAREKMKQADQWLKDEMIGKEGHKAKISEAEALQKNIEDTAQKEFDKLVKAYKDTVTDVLSLKGDDVTSDMKLLSGTFSLTEGDIQRLLEKHEDNFTMTSAICDYSKAHGMESISKERTKHDLEESVKAIQYFSGYCMNAIKEKGTSNAFMNNIGQMIDKTFMNIGVTPPPSTESKTATLAPSSSAMKTFF